MGGTNIISRSIQRYSSAQQQWKAYITTLALRAVRRMGGWPPHPKWMRIFGPWMLLLLAVPVFLSARKSLQKQLRDDKAPLDEFVRKELNRRLVSLREIIQEEAEREERVQAKKEMKASVCDQKEEEKEDEKTEEEEEEEYDDDIDDGSGFGAHRDEDEDTSLKVSDIVSAVNAVVQLDRSAPEVAAGWLLSAKAMARELPEAVTKTRGQEDEEWRNGDKLRMLWSRARRLQMILDGSSRGLWKNITDPWGGLLPAHCKDQEQRQSFRVAASSFANVQEEAKLLLDARDNTQLGKGIRLLWQYRQEIPWMALSTLFVMVEGAISAFPQHYQARLLSVVTERVMGPAAGRDSAAGRRTMVVTSVVDVLSSLLVSHCLTTFIGLLADKIRMLTNQRIGLKMQVDVYHSILQQDIEYWDVHDTDEAFDTLWASADCVDDIMRCPNDLLSMLSNIISTSYILYTKNKSLLYIMMLLTPAQMIVQHYLSGLDYYVSRKAWKKNINSRSDWGEVLDSKNFRTVRSFVREPREVKMFQQELEQETETRATSSALRSLFEPIQSIVGQSSELMGLFYGGKMVVDGTLEAGDLISFIATAQNLTYTLRQLTSFKDNFYQSLDPAARVFDLLTHTPKIGLYGGLKPDENSMQGSLSFKNVGFSYPSRTEVKVLRGASFEVCGGKMCALVGPSGSGKSTILSLVERFYDPSEGEIMLDGIDIKKLDPCWLRSQMAIVSQEPVLFSMSIRENLIYGCEEEPTQEVIEQATRDANIYDFITKKCPNKWRTDVGEGGSEISIGQKQRIAIARALLKNPKILLLDEATSALDSESELLVQQALDRLMKNRTTLVVAHRLSTIRNADHIVAIKNGAVAERGNHEQLLAAKGLYYSYVRKQRLVQMGQEHFMEEEEKEEEEEVEDGEGEEEEEEDEDAPSKPPLNLAMMQYPDMSPVFEGSRESPAFAPSSSVISEEERKSMNQRMDEMTLGTALRTPQSGTTTIFALAPYAAAAATTVGGGSPPRSPTRVQSRPNKENNFVVRSAPTTPVRSQCFTRMAVTEIKGGGGGRLNGRRRRRRGRGRDSTGTNADGGASAASSLTWLSKQSRDQRFYRSVSRLQERLNKTLRKSMQGGEGDRTSSLTRSNNKNRENEELLRLVEDFGHLVSIYGPLSKKDKEKNNKLPKRPQNAVRPLRLPNRETGGGGGRNFGLLRSSSTGNRGGDYIRDDSSGYENDPDEWSDGGEQNSLSIALPLIRTRSYDDR